MTENESDGIDLPEITMTQGQIAYRVLEGFKYLLQAHGLPDVIDTSAVLDWLDARLSLLEEHEAILLEAMPEPSALFSSPVQPERSGFAAKLRASQSLSAAQAMILMGAKLQAAQKENERLRSNIIAMQDDAMKEIGQVLVTMGQRLAIAAPEEVEDSGNT